jgi:hypothetical protein
MKYLFIIAIGLGMVTGCGRKLTPVSTIANTTIEKDSSTQKTKTERHDSSYVERYIKKTLHGSTAEIATTIRKLDSLARVLHAMPSGIDTVYLTDPKKDNALRAYFNKLTGQLVLQCQSRDQIYFEKETGYKKTISLLTNELITYRTKKETTTSTVVVEEKNFWQQLKSAAKDFMWIILILLGIAAVGLMDKIFIWIKNKFNLGRKA